MPLKDIANVKERGHGCLWQLCFLQRRNNSEDPEWVSLKQQKGEIKEGWLKKKGAKKIKEISEVLARPKLKNFTEEFDIDDPKISMEPSPRSPTPKAPSAERNKKYD
ncbi:hypothetical protein U1Q18_022620 [Sarracenia purpurea var. burkii]